MPKVRPPTKHDGPALGSVHVRAWQKAWRAGFGRALLDAGTSALRQAGFGEAVLWVHPDNQRARPLL